MVLFFIFSDNEAITDDPVKTVTNEAFHVSEKPHAHAHIFTAGGVKTYLQNKAVFWHLNSHVVNQNFHVFSALRTSNRIRCSSFCTSKAFLKPRCPCTRRTVDIQHEVVVVLS